MSPLMDASSRPRGQALVEFAIIIPLFLVLLMGILDFGRVVWATTSLASAAREAARYAIVHGGSATDPCPVGPASPDSQIVIASASCPFPSPLKDSIKLAATTAALAGGSNLTVYVCYGVGCSGDTDTAGATNARGQSVTVTVTSTVNLVTPGLLGRPSFDLSGSATMLVNH
jgi:Flp pilus assembly protein TadG